MYDVINDVSEYLLSDWLEFWVWSKPAKVQATHPPCHFHIVVLSCGVLDTPTKSQSFNFALFY